MSSDVDLFCTHIYGESGLTENKPVEVHQISGHASARWVVPPPYIGKGEYQDMQSPSAATPGAAASPSILRHIHVLRTLRLSKSAENFEEHESYRDADILHSSSRRAGPCESASLHSCTGGSAPRPALSAVDILCNKMAPNDLYGNLAGIYTRNPAGRAGLRAASSGADGALHALGYLSEQLLVVVEPLLKVVAVSPAAVNSFTPASVSTGVLYTRLGLARSFKGTEIFVPTVAACSRFSFILGWTISDPRILLLCLLITFATLGMQL